MLLDAVGVLGCHLRNVGENRLFIVLPRVASLYEYNKSINRYQLPQDPSVLFRPSLNTRHDSRNNTTIPPRKPTVP